MQPSAYNIYLTVCTNSLSKTLRLVHEWQIPAFGMEHLQDLTPPFSLLMINDKHTQSHRVYRVGKGKATLLHALKLLANTKRRFSRLSTWLKANEVQGCQDQDAHGIWDVGDIGGKEAFVTVNWEPSATNIGTFTRKCTSGTKGLTLTRSQKALPKIFSSWWVVLGGLYIPTFGWVPGGWLVGCCAERAFGPVWFIRARWLPSFGLIKCWY